jgi:hypothetical protein
MLGWSNGKEGTRVHYRNTSLVMLIDAKNKYENYLTENLCKI